MNEKVNKLIHSRLFVIILIGFLMVTTLLIGTYAWFTWSSTDNTTLTMAIGKLADVTFTDGNAIEGKLNPVFYYYDGLSTSFSANNRDTSGSSAGYKIIFNITSIDPELADNSSDIKYVVLMNNNIIKEGDLTGADNDKTITLYSGNLASGTSSYTIYLYIDGNVENDSSMMNKNITGNIIVEEGGDEGLKFGVLYDAAIEGDHISLIFYEDGSAKTYENGEVQTMPAGSFTYTSTEIIDVASGEVFGIILNGGREIDLMDVILTMVPLNFGKVYSGTVDGQNASFVFYEDGSAKGYVNGEVQTMPAKSLTYTSAEIIDGAGGGVVATILNDGREIDLMGVILTMVPLNFGKDYFVTVDGQNASIVFYEDGSAKTYENGELLGEGPAGTFTYTSTEIIFDGSGEVFGTISSDGTKLNISGESMTVVPLYFDKYYYWPGQSIYLKFGRDGGVMGVSGSSSSELISAGTLKYTTSQIIDIASGEVLGTISSDGTILNISGESMTVVPLYFERLYNDEQSTSLELFIDGSAKIYVNGELASEAAVGTFKYTSTEIIDVASEGVVGTISSNGTQIDFNGTILILQ